MNLRQYVPQPDIERDDVVTPEWVQDAVFYQIFPDRFANGDPANDPVNVQPWGAPPTRKGFQGGDLRGVIQRFDYLLDLGITAIYFNPIFESSANHRYHTTDYFRLDPRLGTLDDFKELLDLAHSHGVRVILDGVFNHCGRGLFQFQDILENGPDSGYLDWFHVKGFPLNAYETARPPNYETWWKVRELPEFNADNPEVRRFLLEVARYWMEVGIDGWRLDVPNEIDDDAFWQEFRRVVKGVNPEAYIVGEIWDDAARWLQGDQFDAVMNYPFRRACLDFFIEGRTDARVFADTVEDLLVRYSAPIVQTQLNLLGSHDTERILTLAGGDVAGVKLAFLMLMTYPGAPCIYYGDEIGLEGGGDPDCRRAMIWDEGRWNHELRDTVRKLIAIRKAHPVLRRGAYHRLAADGDVYAFARTDSDETLAVVLNNGNSPWDVAVPVIGLLADGASMQDLLAGGRYGVDGGEIRGPSLPPRSGTILSVAV